MIKTKDTSGQQHLSADADNPGLTKTGFCVSYIEANKEKKRILSYKR